MIGIDRLSSSSCNSSDKVSRNSAASFLSKQMQKAGLDGLKIDIMGSIADSFLNLHTKVIKAVKSNRRKRESDEELKK